jgi:hypothetical protein
MRKGGKAEHIEEFFQDLEEEEEGVTPTSPIDVESTPEVVMPGKVVVACQRRKK